jgi:hypothetical protein
MIIARHRRRPVSYTTVWFDTEPKLYKALSLTSYICCRDVGEVIGYVRRKRHTKIVDLSHSEECILAGCKKNTAYEFRRAEKDGVRLIVSRNLDEFVDFFNGFAATKGLDPLRTEHLSAYDSRFEILQAVSGDTVWVMNFYLLDRDTARVRMTYSASHFRSLTEVDDKAFVGRANRFIHWEAMKYFKSAGFIHYDLGGYVPETSDPVIRNINYFKDSFGGNLVVEADYQAWPLTMARSIAARLTKTRS